MGHETHFSNKFGVKLSLPYPFFNWTLIVVTTMCIVIINVFACALVHFILNLSISYPYLIKSHDFVNNGQEGMKHQMKGAIQAQ
jgi:1,4-dihydroxy-2-naphthoate octaprenyltransferase